MYMELEKRSENREKIILKLIAQLSYFQQCGCLQDAYNVAEKIFKLSLAELEECYNEKNYKEAFKFSQTALDVGKILYNEKPMQYFNEFIKIYLYAFNSLKISTNKKIDRDFQQIGLDKDNDISNVKQTKFFDIGGTELRIKEIKKFAEYELNHIRQIVKDKEKKVKEFAEKIIDFLDNHHEFLESNENKYIEPIDSIIKFPNYLKDEEMYDNLGQFRYIKYMIDEINNFYKVKDSSFEI